MKIIKFMYKKMFFFIWFFRSFIAWMANYTYDAVRFLRFSSAYKSSDNKAALLARIMAKTHSLEKRLTFQDSNMGRGQRTARALLEALEKYQQKGHETGEMFYAIALSVLGQYFDSQKNNKDINEMREKFIKMSANIKTQSLGGVKLYTSEELQGNKSRPFKDFASSRYSIRDFTKAKIARDTILEAVSIARKAPSACNRQPARVYVIESEEIKRKVLDMLDGIKGFEDRIPNLCAVTSDIAKFYSINERNQSFIDGGIFLMSFLLAFHHLGIAACSLNWCAGKQNDQTIRHLIPIKDSENIIAFVSFGYMPEKCFVAKSLRYEASDIVSFV